MTTIDQAAALKVPKSGHRAALVALLTLSLAGCETGSSLFANSGGTDPATAMADPAAAAVSQGQRARVAIAPAIGPPETATKLIQSQLSSAVERKQISVAKQPTDPSDYTLRGYIVAAREKAGTKLSYVWDVTDPAGKRVNRITGEEVVPGKAQGSDPWVALTPAVIETITTKTANSLAAWIPPAGAGLAPAAAAGVPVAANTIAPAAGSAPLASSAVQTPPPAVQSAALAPQPATAVATPPPGPTTGSISNLAAATGAATSVIIPSVTGAPGDGSLALTSAIQRELAKSGVNLNAAPGAPSYTVEGKVSVGDVKDGKQSVSIDWLIKDPSGKPLKDDKGKLLIASQKNEIAPGSLDGAWGKTADAVAAGAAPTIVKLLPKETRRAGG